MLNADFEGAFVSTDDEQTTVPALLDRLLDRNIELKKSFQDKWMQKMIVPSDHPYLHVTATDPPVYRVLSKREGTGLMLSHLDEKSLHSAAQK
ncbi:hypothetical protein ACOTTU_16625 [Roseobacter sp. EG26]|uniref:hypothetical protein n=1 Tax=Roseobacter sp. EG26 TaxID=3412477 RepID=UPI003CE53D3B